MPPKPVITGRYFIPHGLLSPNKRREAVRALTFKERKTSRVQSIIAEEDDDAPRYVEQIQNELQVGRFGVSLPRSWAIQNITGSFNDCTASVETNIRFPTSISPRDDAQSLFFHRLESEASKSGPQDILAIATTGSGKSVAGIYLGQVLKQQTLIVVDQNKIASGWIVKNMHKFYGKEWCDKYVGRVQQDTCDYRGRHYTIAMAQTLARREYSPEFYRAFGLVIFDEIQVFGGPHFAQILSQFAARVRVGFTAEERTGGFKQLVRAHLGKPRVVSSQEVLQPICYMIRNRLEKPFYCENDGALITNLSRQSERNTKLSNLIKRRGYDRGRNVLVLSNRTAHLVSLRNLCLSLGIPGDAMGLHMAQYETGEYEMCYMYEDSKSPRAFHICQDMNHYKRMCTAFARKKYDQFPSMPKTLYNRLQAGEYVDIIPRKRVFKPNQSELDHITNSCQIVFATYEIFSKGVDVPRLDMGVEALPSGNVKQPLGRILRLLPGKSAPEWYAIDDRIKTPDGFSEETQSRWTNILNKFFTGKTKTRIAALKKANARISYQ